MNGTITIRVSYPDGRCSTLIAWASGEWKVEVFASEDHVREFAEANNLQQLDARE